MKNQLAYLEQKIEELLVEPRLHEISKELEPELIKMFAQYEKTLYDILCVGLVFFRGFSAIGQDEIKMVEAEELIRAWVKSVNCIKSGRIIANLFANGFIATLENLIKDVDEYVTQQLGAEQVGKETLSQFRAEYENIERELNKTTSDKKPLVFYLKPSGKKEKRWLRVLEQLYKMDIDSAVYEIMDDMIKNRQEASHNAIQNQPMEECDKHLKLWHLGTLYLILSIIVAVHKRLK